MFQNLFHTQIVPPAPQINEWHIPTGLRRNRPQTCAEGAYVKAQGLGKFHKHNNDTAKFTWNPPNHTIIASIHINPDLVSAFPFSPAIAIPQPKLSPPKALRSWREPTEHRNNPEQIQNAHRMHLDWLRICTNLPCHTNIHRRPKPILAPACFILSVYNPS